jgi:nucleotide-binding universal stress UspA family protein
MKIIAAFDGTTPADVVVRQIEWLARVPGAEFTFLSFAMRPHETARRLRPARRTAVGIAGQGTTPMAVPSLEPQIVEDKGRAIERALAEHADYLQDIVSRMPDGPPYSVESELANDPAKAIIEYAKGHRADLIVIGTHHGEGILHRLFGDVTEAVVQARVAPVLLVNHTA